MAQSFCALCFVWSSAGLEISVQETRQARGDRYNWESVLYVNADMSWKIYVHHLFLLLRKNTKKELTTQNDRVRVKDCRKKNLGLKWTSLKYPAGL